MSVSQASIGTLYDPHFNNIAWSQPGGPGTQVFPAQANNQPYTFYPVMGITLNEVGQSLWLFAFCGHGGDVVRVFKDYDPTTGMSAAVICCCVCSTVQRLVEPYEDAIISIEMPIKYPILIP